MSLIIIKEPETKSADTAGNLVPGTWFLDFDGHVSAILIDNRTYEKRVITVGAQDCPIIASRQARSVKVKKVLPIGTVFQIAQPGIYGEKKIDQ